MSVLRTKRIKPEDSKSKMATPWTEKEDQLLYDGVKTNGKKCWNTIIETMKQLIPSCNRTADECLRRYSNFLNPSSHSGNWRQGQGVLLMLLHRVNGNKWDTLARILREYSAPLLSEYFYEYLYKIIRCIDERYVPLSLLDQPVNLIEFDYIIELLARKYVPATSLLLQTEVDPHETAVIAWLRQRSIGKERVEEYWKLVCEKFREKKAGEELPICVNLDLDKAQIVGQDAEELISIESVINSVRLKGLVSLQFKGSTKQPSTLLVPAAKSEPMKSTKKFAFPVYRSMLPIFIPKWPQPIHPTPLYQSPPVSSQMMAGLGYPPYVMSGRAAYATDIGCEVQGKKKKKIAESAEHVES